MLGAQLGLFCGALSRPAVDFYAAAMSRNNPVGNRQAQSGSFAHRLGGEEWIEHLEEIGLRDAAAGVLDLHGDALALVREPHRDGAWSGDGLNGVQ